MRRTQRINPAGILLVSLLAVAPATAELDFGDHTSKTLTAKAWAAYENSEHLEALAYVAKCLELHEDKAREMQASLTDYPPNEPKTATSKYWALNDVGTCLFIKGETLLKRGEQAAALEAYKKLVDHFKYAQCWDPKGWYWKPAETAKQRLLEIEFDAE